MTWGYGNAAGLVALSNYAQAQNKFKNTDPIRGRSSECRPLGRNRRYSHFEIKENMRAKEVEGNPLGEWVRTYSAELYGNYNRVEYLPDGTVELHHRSWTSPTTYSFFNYTIMDFGEIVSASGKWYFKSKNGKGYLFEKGVTLKPTGEQVQSYARGMHEVMEVVNPVQEFKYKANRKALNAVKKRYKEFIQYASNMYLIDNKIPTNNYEWKDFKFTEQRYWKTESRNNRTNLFKLLDKFNQSGDLELAFECAILLGGFSNGGYGTHSATKEQIVKGFTEILKYQFAKEVFTAEPVEIGTMFYDRNAKYFS